MKFYKNARGLTIPLHIRSLLPYSLIKLLEKDGHGISFPSKIAAQMRYVKEGTDMGGSYPLSKYKNWTELLLSIVKRNKELRRIIPNSSYGCSPDKGVSFIARYRKDRDSFEYYYNVSYYTEKKPSMKSFYCGNENTMSTERRKHAELTAWHFRREYCRDLDPNIFSTENTENWTTQQKY
jgi:hypothetical protein